MKPFKLTELAAADLFDIWDYTCQKWGSRQADHYLDNLERQCELLKEKRVLTKAHDNISPSLRSLRCERHYIFFLVSEKKPPIILGFLHERMDAIKRLKRRL